MVYFCRADGSGAIEFGKGGVLPETGILKEKKKGKKGVGYSPEVQCQCGIQILHFCSNRCFSVFWCQAPT